MTQADKQRRFVEVYNDLARYPTLIDVALELEISYQTVRNQSTIIRARRRRNEDAPELISRVVVSKKADNDNAVSVDEHARRRADALRADVQGLLQGSRYPIVNPEALVVESFVSEVYDRLSGIRAKKEGTPRTWLSDTLRVESVEEPRGRRFIFTGAQNDAAVHEEFWENLQAYAAHIDADIVVGPWTYETQWWSENNVLSRAYAPQISEFLCFGQMSIGDNFVFAGEMNTLPTANRPISDLTTYSRGRWAVFPHAKLQLKSIPSTDPNTQAHQVMTTGAVTRPKVVPRKAGIKSIFHHVIGATIVEFDEDGDVFCRQLLADDDGSFYDLDRLVRDGKVINSTGVRSMVSGDVHLRKLDRGNALASYGFYRTSTTIFRQKDSIVEILNPREILVHDVFDNESRNHHHVHDNAYSYEMAYRGRDDVFEEVRDVGMFLSDISSLGSKVTVIDSNHDIALDRYVREGRYRNDGKNVKYGLKLELAYIEARERQADAMDREAPVPSFSLLEHAIRDEMSGAVKDISWVHDGYSHVIDGVECGNHGFRGANGARGTVAGFASLGRPMTIADKHSPEICDGVYVAGCMNLRQGYNKGPSGWAVAHVVQYPNGKRALITMQSGKWRAAS